jgi:DNA-binding response OmpR family regulator
MPHTSGRELASQLRKIRPKIRVLFMFGYTDDIALRHGVVEEGAQFLQKPFSPEELAARVRAVLTQRA